MPSATQQKKTPPPLDPRKVKVALAVKGWTQAELAKRVGRSITLVNLTINHNTSAFCNARIRKILAL